MNKLKKQLAAMGAVAFLAATGLLMNSHIAAAQGPPGGMNVQVTGPLPLPVTGSTTVSGPVAVTQSGPWAVGISGTPNVHLSNPISSPAITQSVAQIANNQVTLIAAGTPANVPGGGSFLRVFPDGSRAAFQVPSGYDFVLTNVEITAPLDLVNPVPTTGFVEIILGQQIGASTFGLYEWMVPNSEGTRQFTYSSGTLFAAGSSFNIVVNSSVGDSAARLVFLRGYLIPN